ncbi:hypothetical protein HYW83_01520 [Candidatus Peregrinibacteria bacterium]|nr:hypothetical protein [Candidatus Peregrinibacteria bacterium]
MTKIPTSILRNLLILALSIGLVFATQTVQERVRAKTASGQSNHYVDLLLEGTDFKTDCEKAEQPALIDPRDEVQKVINKYHDTVNCLFNTRIKILVEQMLEPEAEKKKPLTKEQTEAMLKNLSPPEFNTNPETGEVTGRKDCASQDGGLNLSTYCLANAATKEYFAFRSALVVARKKTQQEAGQHLPPSYPTKGSTAEQKDAALKLGIQEYGAVIEKINRELEISKETLDQGLAAYQELQMSLPLHRKYKEVIKSLEEYRGKISSIRKEVELYPTTFLDVTTTQCN